MKNTLRMTLKFENGMNRAEFKFGSFIVGFDMREVSQTITAIINIGLMLNIIPKEKNKHVKQVVENVVDLIERLRNTVIISHSNLDDQLIIVHLDLDLKTMQVLTSFEKLWQLDPKTVIHFDVPEMVIILNEFKDLMESKAEAEAKDSL